MGSKSHTKKTRQRTRRGKAGVVKKEKPRRFMSPGAIKDPKLKERYDKSKTFLANLQSMDLKEMYEDSFPTEEEIAKVRHPTKVNEDEAKIIEALVKKHGEDYAKMFRDHKANSWQWTETQCEKKVRAWKEGKTRSEKAEILSGYGIDKRKPFGNPSSKKRNVFSH